MIITKTPFRMSFFGGGTDIPAFFDTHYGAVLSTTFDKYCYVNVRHLPPFFDYSTELSYSVTERVTDVDAIRHPAIRNAMKMCRMRDIRLTYEGDLPARTGLGTSSSFAVGMLAAFHSLKGSYASKEQLAREAIYLERDLCDEAGGWQDQVAVAFGGLNKIVFQHNEFEVRPIIIKSERKAALESNLMLFFTGFTRSSAQIQQANHIASKTSALKEMLGLVDEAERILVDRTADLRQFGELLDTAWKVKRGMGEVSTSGIDDLYRLAIDAGAIGGKLLGAGGGGFLLFYVEPDDQEAVCRALKSLLHIPFHFEEGGVRVIHYSPEDYRCVDDEATPALKEDSYAEYH